MEEISRVLKKGGKCFATFFLMNPEADGLIHAKASSQNFVHALEGYFTTRPENPEAAIAYREGDVRDRLRKFGLSIIEPVHYGSWCGRSTFLSYQDIVIAHKE